MTKSEKSAWIYIIGAVAILIIMILIPGVPPPP